MFQVSPFVSFPILVLFGACRCNAFQHAQRQLVVIYKHVPDGRSRRRTSISPLPMSLLPPELDALLDNPQQLLQAGEYTMKQLLLAAGDAMSPTLSMLDRTIVEVQQVLIRNNIDISFLQPTIDKIIAVLPPTLGIPGGALLTILCTTLIYQLTNAVNSAAAPISPYPMGKYDANTSKLYFDNRPLESIGRALYITLLSANFLINILLDSIRSKLDTNSDLRASQLTVLLTELGPSFIKIGQSLSIRTDLLSPAYVRGLKTLQDQVPPFDTSEARRMIEEELGVPVENVFSEFSSAPVAAASLGQVYKAKLRSTGVEVAVKVQRPGVMNQIALDMHLIRQAAPFLRRTFNLNTDLADVVDKWGLGFVDELDYQQEGTNAVEFSKSIQKTPLASVVVAPEFFKEYSAGKILVTKWVDGERLDRCTKSDVTALCSIAMNTYLTMMLETGVLHADPHPGNLLRTTDGKLCILDWGMVTKLETNLQTTLVEHIAHLVSADYEEVPKDLLLLGFIDEDKADLIEDSGIVEVLAEVYGAWTKGGGATSINVPKVVSQLQDLQASKGNLFKIPSYFAYIAKSFSVLEGIGLSNDSSYSIIKECLPYVSKRLLTDDKLSGSALNIFLFGPDKYNADRLLNYKRVEDLVEGFAEYSTSASGALLAGNDLVSRKERIENQADLILNLLLLQDEETPLQTIFFDQLAKIISSSSRSIWSTLRERSGTLPSGRTVLGTMVDPLGLWRTSPLVRVNELDEKTIATTRSLIGLFQKQSSTITDVDASSLSNDEVIEISSSLVRKLWERRLSLLKTGGRLSKQLLQMTADRLEKGERDGMFLRPEGTTPPPSDTTTTTDHNNGLRSIASVNVVERSSRLKKAAQLLDEVKALEMIDGMMASEAVTVAVQLD